MPPSAADVERYQKLAENTGTPRSKYLLSMIESVLEDNAIRPKRNISSTAIEELREENERLKERLYIQTQINDIRVIRPMGRSRPIKSYR